MLTKAPDFKRQEAQIAELLAIAAAPWTEGRPITGRQMAASLTVLNPPVARLAIGMEAAGIANSLTSHQIDSLFAQRTAEWGCIGNLLDLRQQYAGNNIRAIHAVGILLSKAEHTDEATAALLAAAAHLAAVEHQVMLGHRIQPLAAGFVEEYLAHHYRFHAVVMDALVAS